MKLKNIVVAAVIGAAYGWAIRETIKFNRELEAATEKQEQDRFWRRENPFTAFTDSGQDFPTIMEGLAAEGAIGQGAGAALSKYPTAMQKKRRAANVEMVEKASEGLQRAMETPIPPYQAKDHSPALNEALAALREPLPKAADSAEEN